MKGAWLMVTPAVAALLLGIGTRTASAIEGTVLIESATAYVGETVEVDLIADVGPPGLAAWDVDPIWDVTVVDAISCRAYEQTVCSTDFADGTGRVYGARTMGLIGETKLATYVFRCRDEPGTSHLELTIRTLTDATYGAPQDIDVGVETGQIACVALTPPESRPTTSTSQPVLPPAGSHAAVTSASLWLIAALVGVATVALGAAFVARKRA